MKRRRERDHGGSDHELEKGQEIESEESVREVQHVISIATTK